MKIRVRNKKLVFAVFAVMIACTLVATGAILTQYGRVETTINARQSVLLDGHGINSMPITNELGEMIGGDPPECFKHTLWNRGAQDSNILIETSITDTDGSWINSDGVYVDYYDLSPELFISDEVTDNNDVTYETLEHYPNNLLVEINHLENCDIEFVVTTPIALEDGSQDNFAIAFDVNNNYDADFQVSFHSNKDDHHPGTYWSYRLVEDGNWVWLAVPSWITVSNVGRHVFTIAFSSDELGGIGSDFRFGVSGSFALSENPVPGASHTYFKYPLDFSWGTNWITSEDYKWQPMGTELGSSFTLQSGEELLFAICYSLHQDIEPADYLVKTKFVPNN